MRKLLNTLYVMSENTYISLENENVIVLADDKVLGRFPLHTLDQIVYFGYRGASPALMGACAKFEINLSFYNFNTGRFLARVCGETHGNVLLRKEQYRISDDLSRSCAIAKNFITAKILNSRSVLNRAKRDHPLSVDVAKIEEASDALLSACRQARKEENLDSLRGFEGDAANVYFGLFDDLILQNKDCFKFRGRVKRPPTDAVNAMLSFVYTILANDCASALEGVGLDAYVGFMHRDRLGRKSLALDLMEELRSVYADRFVLTLINNRIMSPKDFIRQESGAVKMTDDARKTLLVQWQERKKEIITHPFLSEKIPWGLVPHVQALLLARYIRHDLDEYPAFVWN